MVIEYEHAASRGAGNNMTVARADFGPMVDYEHAGANIFICWCWSNVTNKFQMVLKVGNYFQFGISVTILTW